MIKNALLLMSISIYAQVAFSADNCKNVGHDPLFDQILSEIKSCRAHDVHLSFDDGPSNIATPQILKELKKRNTKATFFVSTNKLEKSSALQSLVSQEIAEGHVVGSHGYDHNAYDVRIVNGQIEDKGYGPLEARKQINKSVELLNLATGGKFNKQKIRMFRFPYGRGAMPSAEELEYMEKEGLIVFEKKNYSDRLLQYRKSSRAIGNISEIGFSHLGWNHDSEDFRYASKSDSEANVYEFVKDNVKRLCNSKEKTQVALFHDIKAINAKAIPLIIDIGNCLGLKFVSAPTMMNSSKHLTDIGVLVPKDFQLTQSVKLADDAIGKLINGLAQKQCPLIIDDKACVSSNGKTYKHCQGDESICFDGRWISRDKALEEGKCNLKY